MIQGSAVRLTSAGTGVQMPKAPPKAKKAPTKVKPAPPVPEHVLKKRKKQESAAAEKAKQLVAQKVASKVERRTILNKAKTYAKEYADTAKDLVEKRREAKKHGNFYMEPEPKLMLVVRIRGINAVDPKTRKILQLMRLRKVGVPLAFACSLCCPRACPLVRERENRRGGSEGRRCRRKAYWRAGCEVGQQHKHKQLAKWLSQKLGGGGKTVVWHRWNQA
jgi:hypothetical protein